MLRKAVCKRLAALPSPQPSSPLRGSPVCPPNAAQTTTSARGGRTTASPARPAATPWGLSPAAVRAVPPTSPWNFPEGPVKVISSLPPFWNTVGQSILLKEAICFFSKRSQPVFTSWVSFLTCGVCACAFTCVSGYAYMHVCARGCTWVHVCEWVCVHACMCTWACTRCPFTFSHLAPAFWVVPHTPKCSFQ